MAGRAGSLKYELDTKRIIAIFIKKTLSDVNRFDYILQTISWPTRSHYYHFMESVEKRGINLFIFLLSAFYLLLAPDFANTGPFIESWVKIQIAGLKE